MIQISKRHISVCLGLLLAISLLYTLYGDSEKFESSVSRADDKITCMPDDYIDTPFIKQVKKNETVLIPDINTLETLSREELAVLYHRCVNISLGSSLSIFYVLLFGKSTLLILSKPEMLCVIYDDRVQNSAYIENIQYMCKRKVRLGLIEDGGWDICDEERFRPKTDSCLVYSFGINNDFSFDEAVAKYYGCDVHSFDPSMDIGDFTKGNIHFHNLGISARDEETKEKWQLLRYSSIRSKLGHTKVPISILKMDIEIYEWEVLPDIISSGDLVGTSNLVVEFHLEMSSPEQDIDRYLPALKLLKSLYDNGYRIFWTHQNKWCKFLSKCKQELRTNCHEVNFVRVR